MKEIAIPKKIIQNLLHHAQQTPKQEVCGLISSQNNIPQRSYPIKNTAANPESFFNLDAQQQIQAMANMRDNNEQLFAIYHSHPSAPAIPSNTDIEQANYPDALYIIISLNTKGILELRGYKIVNAQFIEVPLCLT
ncbi:MAG: hypothetical protein GQ529_09845 [Methyloprofundus sp.]|nr:hypothetical protein [Methyloprofundus sp.]